VIAKARAVLAELEAGRANGPLPAALPDDPSQMPLFASPPAALAALRELDPDAMTPKQALEALYRLKGLL
jgi:DNA mismatch repair protein MutS